MSCNTCSDLGYLQVPLVETRPPVRYFSGYTDETPSEYGAVACPVCTPRLLLEAQQARARIQADHDALVPTFVALQEAHGALEARLFAAEEALRSAWFRLSKAPTVDLRGMFSNDAEDGTRFALTALDLADAIDAVLPILRPALPAEKGAP